MLTYYTQGIIIPIVYNIHYNILLDVYHTGTIIHNMNFYSYEKRVSIQKELEEFIRFYNYYNLKECFDWKPKLYLINFCY